LKLRLQVNHVPVHETQGAKVRKITTASKTPSLARMVLYSHRPDRSLRHSWRSTRENLPDGDLTSGSLTNEYLSGWKVSDHWGSDQ